MNIIDENLNSNYKILKNVISTESIRNLSIEELEILSVEIRKYMIESISKTGGHLGANLGVVELTIALHYVFDTPLDKLIWDIGHQSYIHKILTGRLNSIKTIRSHQGLSGFTKISESIYDPWGAGHSSTSISAALGFAIARDRKNENHEVIAVIGDGAISAGIAYEAINNLSVSNTRIITILNDNEMSIAKPVGAVSNHLMNIDKDNNIFTNLDIKYIGGIDGHNIYELIEIFKKVKEDRSLNKPILIHIKTEKGKGFESLPKCDEQWHSVHPFNINQNIYKKKKINKKYTSVFSETIIELASSDEKIIAITAAMPSGTGLKEFSKKFPDRFFDVAISEQHAVTFAAGLAACKMRPFVAIYSTFLQRAYDQIIHDVAIQKLPVRFAIDRAGFVGADGPTHSGSFDIAFLSIIPNMIIMAPSDECELSSMIRTSAEIDDFPSAFRYPKKEILGIKKENASILSIGKARIVKEGSKIAILSIGERLYDSIIASEIIKEKYNIDISVIDMRFIKPIDHDLVNIIAKSHQYIITIEEGSRGGFASIILNHLSNNDLIKKNMKFRNMFFPDYFIDQNSQQEMLKEAGLCVNNIVKTIEDLIR